MTPRNPAKTTPKAASKRPEWPEVLRAVPGDSDRQTIVARLRGVGFEVDDFRTSPRHGAEHDAHDVCARFQRAQAAGVPCDVISGHARLRTLLWQADVAWAAFQDPSVGATAGLRSVDKGDVVWADGAGFATLNERQKHYRDRGGAEFACAGNAAQHQQRRADDWIVLMFDHDSRARDFCDCPDYQAMRAQLIAARVIIKPALDDAPRPPRRRRRKRDSK